MSCTIVHELTIALIVSPQDDAMGSEMPLLTHDQVLENANKIVRAVIDDVIPPGHLATMVVAKREKPG